LATAGGLSYIIVVISAFYKAATADTVAAAADSVACDLWMMLQRAAGVSGEKSTDPPV
jgi:hypothetical protein